jgi:hypothetical protein
MMLKTPAYDNGLIVRIVAQLVGRLLLGGFVLKY